MHFKMSSAISFNLNQSKFCHLVTPLLCTTQSQLSTTLYKKPFGKIVGKGENAGNPKQIPIFQSHLFCRLQMLSIWTSLEFNHLVKS